MKLNINVANKLNRVVKNYIMNKIDVVEILEYYLNNDIERLNKIIHRFNCDMLSEKLQCFENKNIITIEDIRNFRYYLNQINNDVDKEAQERSLYIQKRLLNIIAEEAMASDLEEILLNYDDKSSIQYMLENDIISAKRYVSSDLLYDTKFGNRYSPYYIKYTWEEYKGMYFSNLDEAEEYKYRLISDDKAIYIGSREAKNNTTCILVSMAIATAIYQMYNNHNMSEDCIMMMDYLRACINSEILMNIINEICISSSINDIVYSIIDTIEEIFEALFVKRSIPYLLNYIEIYCGGEVNIKSIKWYIDVVSEDLI